MKNDVPRNSRFGWLLRSISVCVGLVFVLFGALGVPVCIGQMARGADAAVQIVTITIFGLAALVGAFLIWIGLKRRGPVDAASADSPLPAPSREQRSPGAGLGRLIARCGPEKSGQLNSYLWGVALLVFAALCVVAPGWLIEARPGDEQMIKTVSLISAGLSLAFAAGILWNPLLGAPQIIELYENGLVERLGKKARQIDFEAIEHLLLREFYEHRFAPRTLNVKAQVQGQRQLTFSSTLRGEAQRIIEYLASRVRQTEFVEFDTTL